MIRGQGRIDSDGLLAGGDYRLHQHAISTHQGRSVLEMMLSASSQSNRPLCWTLPVRPNLSSQCCRPSWPSGNGQSVVGDAVLERAANQDVWSQANETPSASACWSAAATFIAALDQLSADRYGGRMHDVPRGRPDGRASLRHASKSERSLRVRFILKTRKETTPHWRNISLGGAGYCPGH